MVGDAYAAYAQLLRTPGALAFSLAALVGRLPIAMLGIGSVLLVEDQRGSYALAGAASAAYAVGRAVFGPQLGRVVDARGQGRVLPLALVGHAVGVLGLVLLTVGGAPAPLVLAAALLTGGALPTLGSCVRTRWTDQLRRLDRPDERDTAFAYEAVVDEVVFVLGPVIVVVVATLLDPVAALLVTLALGASGTLAFAAQRSTEPAVEPRPVAARSAIRAPGVQVLALTMAGIGTVFGALEVVLVAFADERGPESASGPLLALVALGSAVSGLAYGARQWRRPLQQRLLVALALHAVGVVPLLLAPSVPTMAVAAFAAGVAISPSLIATFALVTDLVPVSSQNEGYTWMQSGLTGGVAVGFAVGGALTESISARAGFAVCLAGAVLALAVAAAGRRRLLA